MSMAQRFRPLHLFASVALFAGAACSDHGSLTEPPRVVNPSGASRSISDGAHNGGNTDVFFLPPMVSNPSSAPGYGDPFDPGLASAVSFRISDRGPTGASTPQLLITLPPSQVKLDVTNQFYSANWDTQAIPLTVGDIYRIEVLVGTKMYAFADVFVAANGVGLKNLSGDLIGLVDGRTLPIRVRIEKGFDCLSKVSCATQVVSSTLDPAAPPLVVSSGGTTPTSVALTGTWALDPNTGQAITTPVVLTIQDVSTAVTTSGGCSQGLTAQVSQQHCMKITTDPQITVGTPIVVGMCSASITDKHQLLLKFDVNESPTYLQEAPPPVSCPAQTSARPSSNPFVRLASAVLSGASRVLGVQTAYAFDDGPGGIIAIGSGLSYIAPAYPEAMSMVPGGDGQTQIAGSVLANRDIVRLTYLHNDGGSDQAAEVVGAAVSCQALTPGGGLWSGSAYVSTPVPATDNKDGTYTCPAQLLSTTPGPNQVQVTAANLDPSIVLETSTEPLTYNGIATFNATSSDVQTFGTAFDPDSDATASPIQGVPAPDIAAVSAGAANGTLTLNVQFVPGALDAHHTYVIFSLDTDQNPATGQPGVNASGTIDNGVIGADYIVQMGSDFQGANATLLKYSGTLNQFTAVGTYPVTFNGDAMSVSIPLRDVTITNGLINFKATSSLQTGTNTFTGILDYAPDVGQVGQTVALPPIG
jgi:hypothetical protein